VKLNLAPFIQNNLSSIKTSNIIIKQPTAFIQ
jgi:hypothetical protein